MSGWQYKREDGEVVGILSEDEIKRCAERGGISLDSPVMHEEKTRGKWVPARKIKPLRNRIEAYAQEHAAPEETQPQPVYVPPKPKSSGAQLGALWGRIQGGSAAILTSVARVAESLTAKKPLHVCLKCEAEFAKYEVLGKCPLCGEWAVVACKICGLESGAKRFVENDCKCPRCGGKVNV